MRICGHPAVYQVQNTTIPEIVQPITGESVYGTQNSIEMISPSVLEQYRWLLKNVTPPVARLHQMTGYVVSHYQQTPCFQSQSVKQNVYLSLLFVV